jgi:hypothetical protein
MGEELREKMLREDQLSAACVANQLRGCGISVCNGLESTKKEKTIGHLSFSICHFPF